MEQIIDAVTLRYQIVKLLMPCSGIGTVTETAEFIRTAKELETYIKGDADLPEVHNQEDMLIKAFKEFRTPQPESPFIGPQKVTAPNSDSEKV